MPKDAGVRITKQYLASRRHCIQVGVDMSRFREFPYRGSLLQSQNGSIQEVSIALETPIPSPATLNYFGLNVIRDSPLYLTG